MFIPTNNELLGNADIMNQHCILCVVVLSYRSSWICGLYLHAFTFSILTLRCCFCWM